MISQASSTLSLAGADVHRDHAAVDVLLGVGADRVGEPALLADLAEQARGGRAAEDRVEHAEREAALVAARDPGPPKQMWYCSVSFGVEARSRGSPSAPRRRARRRRSSAGGREQPLGELDDPLVLEVAGRARRRCWAPCSARRGRRRSRAPGSSAITSALAEHPAAERVIAVDRLARARRGRGPGARPRTSRSPRAPPRARSRSRRAAAPARAASRPSGRRRASVCSSRKRACRCVVSLLVAALAAAPIPSKSSEISIAEWRSVPLKSRCSRKCETPACAGVLVARSGAHPEPERDRAHRGHHLGDDPQAASRARSARRPRERRPAARRRPVAAPRSVTPVAPAAAAVAPAAVAPRSRPPRPPARRGRGRRDRRRRPSSGRRCRASASSSGLLPAIAGSSERRRPIRPRSLSTSATVTSISSPADEHVLDRVDPLAGLDVRDVQQAVGALRQLDEGAEGGRLDDLALELVADLGLAGHRLDPLDARPRPARRSARRRGRCRRRRCRSRPRTPPACRGSSRRPCR